MKKATVITCVLVLILALNFMLGLPRISTILADSPQQFDGQISSFIEEARRASAAGERKTLVLTLSEEDVTHKLTEIVEKNKRDIPVSVNDIQVHFHEGSVHLLITAKAKYFILSTKVSADVLITPEGKHGCYEVVGLSLGYMPRAIVDWITKRIPYELSGPLPLGDLPVELQDICLTNGKLYIEAITIPAH